MYKLITAPTSEPISTADARLHLRNPDTSFNDLVDDCVKAARTQFESDVPCMQLLPATWGLYLDEWPSWDSLRKAHVLIEKMPLIGITHIKYYPEGEANLSEAWDTENYEADLISYPGRIKLIADELPALNENKYNKVQITFTCGYATAAAIPSDIIQALKLLIGHYYENPQQIMSGTQINELPLGYKQVVYTYMKSWV